MANETNIANTGSHASVRLTSGVVGQDPGARSRYWRQANLALLAATALMAAWFAWVLFAPNRLPADTPESAADGVPSEARPAAPLAQDYRAAIIARKLFVLPLAGPGAVELDQAIAKAKARLTLRGISRVGERLGAYFEVRDNAPSAEPKAPAKNGKPAAPPKRGARGGMALYFEGDQVGDFTVKKIEPNKVILTLAGREVTFSL